MHARLAAEVDQFAFREVADGVVVAVARARPHPDANAVLVDLGGEVLVVDTHARRSSAEAVAAFAARRFDGPIRTVVDTHHHWDHWQGNRFHARNGVRLVAHPAAIAALRSDVPRSIADQRIVVAGIKDTAGPADVADLDAYLAELDELADAVAGVEASAAGARAAGIPDTPVGEALTVAGARREVRIVHLGHAHTAGDLIVEIPDASAIATGDCVVAWTPVLRDANPEGWLEVLDRLRAGPAEHLLMGHGEPAGREWLAEFRAYLVDLLDVTRQAFADGARGDRLVEVVRAALRPDHEAVLDAAAAPGRRWFHRMPANVARVEALLAAEGSVE